MNKRNDGKPRRGITENRKIKKKAEAKRKNTVTVTLPVPIPGNTAKDAYTKTEYELSYEDSMLCVRISELAAKGFNNEQIIARCGVSRDTFYKRLKEEPYFSYCLLKHRGLAVLNVENALYSNAIGFEYTEQAATPSGAVVTLRKQKLPETKAQEFFLTNRAATDWKKKVEQTVQPGNGVAAMTFIVKRREE